MKEKNFVRGWLGLIVVLVALAISVPVSYFFQAGGPRGASISEYLHKMPQFFGHIDQTDHDLVTLRNTVIWTGIILVVIGFVLSEIVQRALAPPRRKDDSASRR